MSLFGDLPPPTESKESGSKRSAGSSQDELGSGKRARTDTGSIQLQGVVAARRGERDEMQDAHVVLDDGPPVDACDLKLSYYAVFDGHAGANAAHFCAEKMHGMLAKRFEMNVLGSDETEIKFSKVKRCLIDTFQSVDREFLALAAEQEIPWRDGCRLSKEKFYGLRGCDRHCCRYICYRQCCICSKHWG
eukprot:m.172179 g.172179  ORF g.172179 m.172179 type:complete len:190 (+) comp15362_c0_seq2:244-813(+)